MPRRRNKPEERDVAARRIGRLLAAAEAEAAAGRQDLADRYGMLVLRIAQKHQTGLDRAAKSRVCRKCGAFRYGARTSRTRTAAGRVVTTCLRCGHVTRRALAP